MPQVQLPRRYSPSGYVVLDGNTQRNLELVSSIAEKSKRGTLLGVLDRTLTSMGGRKLRHWILHPLLDVDAIRARLDGVGNFFEDTELRLTMRELLKGVADLERLMGRITSKAGNARDVKALGRSLDPGSRRLRAGLAAAEAPLLQELCESLDPPGGWCRVGRGRGGGYEPPLPITEGNILKDGFNEELDRLASLLVRGGRDWIAALQQEERANAQVSSNLKVGYNKVFGYYLEVTKGNLASGPRRLRAQADPRQCRALRDRQRLKEQEEEIVNAQERMQRLEYDLFVVALRERHRGRQRRRIQQTADSGRHARRRSLSLAEAGGHQETTPNREVEASLARSISTMAATPSVEDLMSRGDFVPNDTKH